MLSKVEPLILIKYFAKPFFSSAGRRNCYNQVEESGQNTSRYYLRRFLKKIITFHLKQISFIVDKQIWMGGRSKNK